MATLTRCRACGFYEQEIPVGREDVCCCKHNWRSDLYKIRKALELKEAQRRTKEP